MGLKENLMRIKGEAVAIHCPEEWMLKVLWIVSKEICSGETEYRHEYFRYGNDTHVVCEGVAGFIYGKSTTYPYCQIYEFDEFCKIDIPIKITDETINKLLDEKFGKGEWIR